MVTSYKNIAVEGHGSTGLIKLNRPDALNALSSSLIAELNDALDLYEADTGIGAIVITGSEKVFAAGADIKEMVEKDYAEAFSNDFISKWERVTRSSKP